MGTDAILKFNSGLYGKNEKMISGFKGSDSKEIDLGDAEG